MSSVNSYAVKLQYEIRLPESGKSQIGQVSVNIYFSPPTSRSPSDVTHITLPFFDRFLKRSNQQELICNQIQDCSADASGKNSSRFLFPAYVCTNLASNQNARYSAPRTEDILARILDQPHRIRICGIVDSDTNETETYCLQVSAVRFWHRLLYRLGAYRPTEKPPCLVEHLNEEEKEAIQKISNQALESRNSYLDQFREGLKRYSEEKERVEGELQELRKEIETLKGQLQTAKHICQELFGNLLESRSESHTEEGGAPNPQLFDKISRMLSIFNELPGPQDGKIFYFSSSINTGSSAITTFSDQIKNTQDLTLEAPCQELIQGQELLLQELLLHFMLKNLNSGEGLQLIFEFDWVQTELSKGHKIFEGMHGVLKHFSFDLSKEENVQLIAQSIRIIFRFGETDPPPPFEKVIKNLKAIAHDLGEDFPRISELLESLLKKGSCAEQVIWLKEFSQENFDVFRSNRPHQSQLEKQIPKNVAKRLCMELELLKRAHEKQQRKEIDLKTRSQQLLSEEDAINRRYAGEIEDLWDEVKRKIDYNPECKRCEQIYSQEVQAIIQLVLEPSGHLRPPSSPKPGEKEDDLQSCTKWSMSLALFIIFAVLPVFLVGPKKWLRYIGISNTNIDESMNRLNLKEIA